MGSASSRYLPDVAAILPDVAARRATTRKRTRYSGGLIPDLDQLFSVVREQLSQRAAPPFGRQCADLPSVDMHAGHRFSQRKHRTGSSISQAGNYQCEFLGRANVRQGLSKQEFSDIVRGVTESRPMFQNTFPLQARRPDFGLRKVQGNQTWHHPRRNEAVSSMPFYGGIERTAAVVIGTGLSGLAVASELRRRGVDVHHRGRARPSGRRQSGQHLLAAPLRRAECRHPAGTERDPPAPEELRREPQPGHPEQPSRPPVGPPRGRHRALPPARAQWAVPPPAGSSWPTTWS